MPILCENIKIFLLYVVLTIISLHTSNVPYYVNYWFIDLSTQRYTTDSSNVYGNYWDNDTVSRCVDLDGIAKLYIICIKIWCFKRNNHDLRRLQCLTNWAKPKVEIPP